jgi:predicted negative regulator of RcsB-dependent stress response
MAAKLSKKDLEGPDIFQSSLEKFGDYVSENKTRVYVVVIAVVCAVIISIGIYLYWNNYQSSASKLYTKAQAGMLKSDDKPEAVKETVKILKEITEKYPYSWSAKISHYHLGNIYYNTTEIDNAIDEYTKFVSSVRSDNTGVKFLALTSLGYCYESKKNLKEALKYFEEAQTSYNTGFESTGYRNIARIYEALNDKKKALENYQNALQKTTDPATVIFIKRKIATLS